MHEQHKWIKVNILVGVSHTRVHIHIMSIHTDRARVSYSFPDFECYVQHPMGFTDSKLVS